MDIKDTLKRLSELHEAASPAPWGARNGATCTANGGDAGKTEDLALIALARNELPQLLDHIERLESANRALRHEQQRLRRAPEKDWQQLSAALAPAFAKLVTLGCDDLAKTGIAALDQARTYVNRVLTERDQLAERENQTI